MGYIEDAIVVYHVLLSLTPRLSRNLFDVFIFLGTLSVS